MLVDVFAIQNERLPAAPTLSYNAEYRLERERPIRWSAATVVATKLSWRFLYQAVVLHRQRRVYFAGVRILSAKDSRQIV